MRYRTFFFALVAFAAPAQAQAPATIPVFFSLPGEDWRTKPLGDAIRTTLSRTPGFNLMATVTPQTLVITLPQGLGGDGHGEKASYNFTVRFSRDGRKIGDSIQSCTADTLSECADQIAADAQSAAGMVR